MNPLASTANRCFVCGNGNPIGLNVRFRLDGDVCRAEFTPGEAHVGYDGVTHGGILFSLLDDVMANYVFLRGERCYTAKAEVRYRAALPVGIRVALEGRQVRRKGRLVVLQGRVIRADTDEVVAEATGSFMVEDQQEHKGMVERARPPGAI
ncbi:MAG: PaaI family thioesterase [Gammaproteobacteria bacterium]|nr:PaaI family thioesterase [Gammaproteobacteria bacterium]